MSSSRTKSKSTDTEVATEVEEDSIAIDDVDDVIEIASELQEESEDRLTEAEVAEVAAEVGIDPDLVDDAIDELRERRDEEAQREREAIAARKRLLRRVSIGVGAVVVVLVIALLTVRGGLSTALNEVDSARAQVVNVIERQASTVSQWSSEAPSPERSAELAGAENRVRIERLRYDEAASAYNDRADNAITGLFRGLLGYPARVPLSNEVTSW